VLASTEGALHQIRAALRVFPYLTEAFGLARPPLEGEGKWSIIMPRILSGGTRNSDRVRFTGENGEPVDPSPRIRREQIADRGNKSRAAGVVSWGAALHDARQTGADRQRNCGSGVSSTRPIDSHERQG
jgi:hypothetical protein